jgi:membrane-bound lytic murein transglycosylase D
MMRRIFREHGLQPDLVYLALVESGFNPWALSPPAARYSSDLYRQFGSWYLAAAGYNAGENRVEGVIRRHPRGKARQARLLALAARKA